MSNEIKTLAARVEAATEETGKAETAYNAGDRALDAVMQDRAALEGQCRQAEARLEEDPLGAVKELARLRKEIEDVDKIAERVRVIADAKARATRNRLQECLSELNAARGDLARAICAEATKDLDGKAIRQLKRGWVSLMLSPNTCPPWHVYLHSVLPAPDDTEIRVILGDLRREFPVLGEA